MHNWQTVRSGPSAETATCIPERVTSCDGLNKIDVDQPAFSHTSLIKAFVYAIRFLEKMKSLSC